jgi:hypothetical protein
MKFKGKKSSFGIVSSIHKKGFPSLGTFAAIECLAY